MPNILILGIGGPTPRSIAKRLRFLYPDANLIGTDIQNRAIGFYMNGLLDHCYTIPKASAPDYWSTIEKIIRDHQIDMAFVQPEQEVKAWGEYFRKAEDYPCPALMPPLEHVEILMDKAAMSDFFKDTAFIPETIRVTPDEPKLEAIQEKIGYPCWIRASKGSGGFGSLKVSNQDELQTWLYFHKAVPEFTVSEFLPGRHLANQMLYLEGQCVRNAGLHCVEYVMSEIAPSKVTGNTSYGLLINEEALLQKCEEVMDYVSKHSGQPAHGVYSFDFKEDANGNLKVTEINIRHMAYTGIMAEAGFDLIKDSVEYLRGHYQPPKEPRHYWDKDYAFLRDVDIEPILLEASKLKSSS